MLLSAILKESVFENLEPLEIVKLTNVAAMLHDINTKFGDNDESSHKHIAYGVQALIDGKDPSMAENFIDYPQAGITTAQYKECCTIKEKLGKDISSVAWDEFATLNKEVCSMYWGKIQSVYNSSDAENFRIAFMEVAKKFAWYAIAAKWTHTFFDE